MKILLPYLKPYKKQLTFGPIAKLLEAIFELTLPLLMASLIDVGVKNHNKAYIINISLIMVFISLIGFFCAIYCQYSASITSQGFGTMLRNSLVEKISAFSYKEIDSFGTETLVNRTINDVNQLQVAVAMLIRLVIRAPFLSIGGIIMASRINKKLSLTLLIFTPIFIIVLYFIMKSSIPFFKKTKDLQDNILLLLKENFTGVRVIRAFVHTQEEKRRFSESNNNWEEVSTKAEMISSMLSPLTLFIMNIATLFIIWFGGIEVNSGFLTQGELIAFINYITQILLALIVVANLAVLYSKSFTSCKRIIEILEIEPSISNKKDSFNTITDYKTAIELKNVSFSYTNDNKYALQDISFSLSNGKTMGIIGGTGSGKSTLINLLPRFYAPTKGDILINGSNSIFLNLESLRNLIRVVPQKPMLFAGTIKSNILVGNKKATKEDIENAISISQSKEFINNTKDGLDSDVTSNGSNLSGGQKQRLTIARALVSNPKILILDDSSSALDYATDFKLRKEIKKSDTTTIIVSQRISSVKDCDFIIVLNNGRLVSKGTHAQLILESDLYKEIAKSQNYKEME